MAKKKLQPKFNGARIARARREQGMTQTTLAKAVSLTRYQVLRIEKSSSASLDSLHAICHRLEIPLSEVFVPDPVLSA